MPVAGGGAGGNRQTFRPPWVKDGPPPIPMPSQPWVKSNRMSAPPTDTKEAAGVVTNVLRRVSDVRPPADSGPAAVTPARKTSSISITPSQPKENGTSQTATVRSTTSKSPEPSSKAKAAPQPARKVSEPQPKPSTEQVQKVPESVKKQTEPVKPILKPPATKPVDQIVSKPPEPPAKPVEKTIAIERTPSRPKVLERSRTSDKYEGLAVPPKPPAAPPMPPPPPPLPSTKQMLPSKAPLSETQAQKLDALRSRPKRRPDWGNMMKEIETGRKLCHVTCNDRSAPLIPIVKDKGQFLYESERPNVHNQLLKQIESGVRLKPTKTNDRSKPFIDGLRKFRRQMTIEEQIQKSTSMASMGIVEIEPDPLDEVDDIDKVRDDLQSTKQLLAMELKNKETLERENKKLLTRILNLEVELEKEKNRLNKDAPEDRKEMKREMDIMKQETEQAKKLADDLETKYHDVQAKLDLAKLDLDEAVTRSQRLEKQLKVAQAANLANSGGQALVKNPSNKKIMNQNKSMDMVRQPTIDQEESETSEEEEEESEEESETETEGEEEDAAVAAERRQARELKLLNTKLKSCKDKRENAKKERKSLKEQTTKLQKSLRDEKKKYKVLQKEVDSMSKLINEGDDEDEEEEEEEGEEEESEEESEESEESSSDSEQSEGDLPESEPIEKRKSNLQNRVKHYENLLSSLKKGNYLLKANIDRYKDELNKQKEMAISLQEDLSSVLAELG